MVLLLVLLVNLLLNKLFSLFWFSLLLFFLNGFEFLLGISMLLFRLVNDLFLFNEDFNFVDSMLLSKLLLLNNFLLESLLLLILFLMVVDRLVIFLLIFGVGCLGNFILGLVGDDLCFISYIVRLVINDRFNKVVLVISVMGLVSMVVIEFFCLVCFVV